MRLCPECDTFECIHGQDCCESCAPGLGLCKCATCKEWVDEDETHVIHTGDRLCEVCKSDLDDTIEDYDHMRNLR